MEDGAHANTTVSRHDSGPASPVGKRSRGAALTGHVGFAACVAASSQQVWDVTTQQWRTPLAGRGGVRVRPATADKKKARRNKKSSLVRRAFCPGHVVRHTAFVLQSLSCFVLACRSSKAVKSHQPRAPAFFLSVVVLCHGGTTVLHVYTLVTRALNQTFTKTG